MYDYKSAGKNMNIEIGRKYKIVNSHAGNDGIVVIVTGYAGPAGFENCHRSAGGHRYFVDRQIKTSHGDTVNHVAEHQLKPCLLYTSPSPRDS